MDECWFGNDRVSIGEYEYSLGSFSLGMSGESGDTLFCYIVVCLFALVWSQISEVDLMPI